jgi:alkyl hydroperoxide reductase subunit AhpC
MTVNGDDVDRNPAETLRVLDALQIDQPLPVQLERG